MAATGAEASAAANKALLRRYKVGILNSRDVDALGEVAAVDYLDHAAFPGHAPGLVGLKQRVTTLIQALDPYWTIHDIVAEGDMVVLRWSHKGTHVGEFLGIPATGRKFISRGIDMYRVRDGLMAEHWNVVDMFGFCQQVGVIAGPRSAGW
jgi:predicted ester cyclase